MKLQITKDDVLRALETEDLRPGYWWFQEEDIDGPECMVCAVGSLLRMKGVSRLATNGFGDKLQVKWDKRKKNSFYDDRSEGLDRDWSLYNAREFLSEGDHLSALSQAFEYFEGDRDQTKDWVKEHLPSMFEVEV